MLLLLLRRLAMLAVLVFALGGMVWAQFSLPLNHVDPDTRSEQVRELVSKYCRLDYDGTRLDPQGWPKLQPLLWARTNPDYTQIDVISRYTVETAPTSTHGKYNVMVHYRLVGRFESGIGYSREVANSDEAVQYTITNANDEWRIEDVDPNFPHPSRPAMLKWLSDKISATQDPAARKIYADALRDLQSQSASPFAK